MLLCLNVFTKEGVKMALIFISHSSKDKEKIAKYVQAI